MGMCVQDCRPSEFVFFFFFNFCVKRRCLSPADFVSFILKNGLKSNLTILRSVASAPELHLFQVINLTAW